MARAAGSAKSGVLLALQAVIQRSPADFPFGFDIFVLFLRISLVAHYKNAYLSPSLIRPLARRAIPVFQSVLETESQRQKRLFAFISIVDPDLMMTVPKKLTAYRGMGAFFHAAGGYIAACATPMSDLYALKSIELIAQWLPVVVKNGQHEEARAQIAFANTLLNTSSVPCCRGILRNGS